jgi:hypothetical protein
MLLQNKPDRKVLPRTNAAAYLKSNQDGEKKSFMTEIRCLKAAMEMLPAGEVDAQLQVGHKS